MQIYLPPDIMAEVTNTNTDFECILNPIPNGGKWSDTYRTHVGQKRVCSR